jgi:tRNA threonylcarbamoyladenosine biosynthesis protein TsaE
MQLKFSLEQMELGAREFWKLADGWKVFAFHGPMASGKTTIITALCRYLGVQDVVGSPTYSIINEYSYFQNGTSHILYHMDLYRLENEAEVIQAGVEDCLSSGEVCMVEWPDRSPGLFDGSTVHIHISILNDSERCVEIRLPAGVSS